MSRPSDADRLLRLRAARVTGGLVPADLWPWLLRLAAAADEAAAPIVSPADQLAVRVSAEIDRWMTRRGVTTRTISVRGRTIARALKGRAILTSSLADIADALDCDVEVQFRARAR